MQDDLSDRKVFEKGMRHISRADPVIRGIVKKQGRLEFRARGMVFKSLVEAILSQQLNGRSADAIITRVNKLCMPGIVSARKLQALDPADLRKAGVSPQKLGYLKDLTARVGDGRLDLARLTAEEDQKVIETLDEVKGIGKWTAQMVLMFSLGRADVLPVDDFGIRKSIQDAYGLVELPKAKTIEKIAEPWHPYCSVASLYLWHNRD